MGGKSSRIFKGVATLGISELVRHFTPKQRAQFDQVSAEYDRVKKEKEQQTEKLKEDQKELAKKYEEQARRVEREMQQLAKEQVKEKAKLEAEKKRLAQEHEELSRGNIETFHQNMNRMHDRQIAAIAQLPDIAKQPTFSVALMGKTSTGKTTTINTLFNTREAVSVLRCTEGVNCVFHNDDVTIYDVFGDNDEETYHELQHLQYAKTLHLIVVVYTDAVDNVLNLARLCQALRVKLIFFRNKCERFTDEDTRIVLEHDSAKLRQYVTEQEVVLVVGAADPPKNLDWLQVELRAPRPR